MRRIKNPQKIQKLIKQYMTELLHYSKKSSTSEYYHMGIYKQSISSLLRVHLISFQ